MQDLSRGQSVRYSSRQPNKAKTSDCQRHVVARTSTTCPFRKKTSHLPLHHGSRETTVRNSSYVFSDSGRSVRISVTVQKPLSSLLSGRSAVCQTTLRQIIRPFDQRSIARFFSPLPEHLSKRLVLFMTSAASQRACMVAV